MNNSDEEFGKYAEMKTEKWNKTT